MIRRPRAEELDAVATFIAELQDRPEDRLAGFGTSAAELAIALETWETPWFGASVVDDRAGRIVGFLELELDDSLGRAWLFGPLVSSSSWDAIADALLAALLGEVPQAVAHALHQTRDLAERRPTVGSTTTAALTLYAELGFERTSSMVGYRRPPGETP